MGKEQQSLVSVIIPAHNYANYLGQAIESVLTQSYRRFEIIVVDDGSVDNTKEVAARYASVRYIYQECMGVSRARNRGLAESKGDYVVFLDADDELMRTALEVGVRCLDSNPDLALAAGYTQWISREGAMLPTMLFLQYMEGDFYTAMLRRNFVWTTGASIYRREAVVAANGFDSAAECCEDFDLNLRISSHLPAMCHGKIVVKYRKHGSSISGDQANMLHTILRVLTAHYKGIKEKETYKEHYEQGVSYYKFGYGGNIVRIIYTNVRRRRHWKQTLRCALTLLRYYPKGLARVVVRLGLRFALRKKAWRQAVIEFLQSKRARRKARA